jgi:hypothetical protein
MYTFLHGETHVVLNGACLQSSCALLQAKSPACQIGKLFTTKYACISPMGAMIMLNVIE